MTAFAVAVIGHVDHGKTALVRALTGKETDRLAEERARGMSIVAGYAQLRRDGCEIDLIDLPGHERFLRAMISGAGGVGAVLLCVAATEGPKPQTLEHLEIARLLGIGRAVCVVTKCDLADSAMRERRAAELGELATRYGFDGAPVLLSSAVSGDGVAALAQALEVLACTAPPARDDGFAYMPVDRAFAAPGFGPVVTGTLRRGGVQVGDVVAIHPARLRATIRSLQIHGRSVRQAPPGRRVAVALRGVALQDLGRGMALATPGALADASWLDVDVAATRSGVAALRDGQSLRLLSGTLETDCRLRLLDRRELFSGEHAIAQIKCAEAVALPAREGFILRCNSPAMTLGGGRVLDPTSRRRRRGSPPASLVAQAAGEQTQAILQRLLEAGSSGAEPTELARFAGCDAARVRRRLAALDGFRQDSSRFFHPDVWRTMLSQLKDAVARQHVERPLDPGLRLDSSGGETAQICPDDDVVKALVADLARRGDLVLERGFLRSADFRPGAGGSADVAREVAQDLRRCGLTPVDEGDLVGADPQRRQALRFLIEQGLVLRTKDRVQKRTILFHREAAEAARLRLGEAFPQGRPFLAREAGAVLGISRKFSIPLLEHFDAVRVTMRQGDHRVVVQDIGGDWGLVSPLVFKTSGSPKASGGFDSHPPPPDQSRKRADPAKARERSG